MTSKPVLLDELLAARAALVTEMVGNMPEAHRRFLISFEKGDPEWPLLGIEGAANLPAVLWRQQNLDSLDATRRGALVQQLKAVLGIDDGRS